MICQIRTAILLVGCWSFVSLGASVGQTPAAQPKSGGNDLIEKAAEFFQKGNAAEAFKTLQEAAKKQPSLPPPRVMMARLFFQANQVPNGKALLEDAAAEMPDHPEVYLSLASQALGERRFTETILSCQAALAVANSDRWSADQKKVFQREARAGLSAAFEARNDWAGVRTHITALLELEPKNGPVRQRLARALFFLNRPDDAHTELLTAIKDDPTLDSAGVLMGRFWTAKADLKKAEEWLQKSVQKEPDSARVHHAFGLWLFDQGRVPEAKIHADTAAKLDPKSKDADRLRGLIARFDRDLPTAERMFDTLHRESPGDFYSANQLALVLMESKEERSRSRAVQLAEVNARQYPRNAEALATLGIVYYRLGRLDEAEKMLMASVSGGQASSDTAYFLGALFNDRGKPDEARKFLDSALAARGPFIYKKDAQALLAKLPPATKDKK